MYFTTIQLTERQNDVERYLNDKFSRIRTCPLYIKISEFTKLEKSEMWFGKPFYLCKGYKVRLWIITSCDRDPLLQLCLTEDSCNKKTMKGELKVLLVKCNANNNNNKNLLLISDNNCVVRANINIISAVALSTVNPQVDKFFRDDGVMMLVSFEPHSDASDICIGLTIIVVVIAVLFIYSYTSET